MTTSIIPGIHLTNVYHILIDTYGELHNDPDFDPLGGLIGTILSQHTSDINSGRAYRQLVDTYPTWEEVRDAPTYKVADAIRSGGLANIKSIRIQDVLHTLMEKQQEQGGDKSLGDYLSDELDKLSSEDGWKYLQQLPGVGPKTAACVMLFNLGRNIMPIDTHVWRTSKRLGLIGPSVNANQAHTVFAKIAPPAWVYMLHVGLIRHGRQICHAQKPKCNQCPLYRECAYTGSVNPQETGIS
ncbi:endonuclease III domain-containing protein [Dictyobacter arantiisoli]|uniref:Endonuclease III n=1 Tax=Dictyobacter arantiisoli TaxID=2014874 RepID=A0A5A5TKA0_9CHLR|nr:endonuclease III [Dictyobacter arantiisoli]GCF11506.1 endonuclease III [Dictyobacter arantiisoli]